MKTRVQLKNDISSDGEVVAKGAAKARWKVKWTEGPHKGSTTDLQLGNGLRVQAFGEPKGGAQGRDAAERARLFFVAFGGAQPLCDSKGVP